MSSTKGKTLYFNNKSMDYVTFGKGKKPLVIIPGLGDGLATVKGMAQMLALAYRALNNGVNDERLVAHAFYQKHGFRQTSLANVEEDEYGKEKS